MRQPFFNNPRVFKVFRIKIAFIALNQGKAKTNAVEEKRVPTPEDWSDGNKKGGSPAKMTPPISFIYFNLQKLTQLINYLYILTLL